jgi:hypothetical protein
MVKMAGDAGHCVGDVVRGGNVLGEEAFFTPNNPNYRESASIESDNAAIL